jgi:NTP pyrophosphatase (non-canonical NTP hydrolase)
MATLAELQVAHGRMMIEKGFRASPPADRHGSLVRLALCHTELSEAAQVVKRRGVDDPAARAEVGHELADAFLRVLDLADTLGIDFESAVLHKMGVNLGRPKNYGTPNEVKGV